MDPVTGAEFGDFLKFSDLDMAAQAEELAHCVAVATEYVESQTGPIATRVVRTSVCREAILNLAKHVRQARGTASTRGAVMGGAEQVPSVVGYMIPNRVKTLIDAMRYDDSSSIGIG